jgi:hypothetical protein
MFVLPVWVTPHVIGLSTGYAIWAGGVEERVVAWSEVALSVLDFIVVYRAHGNMAAVSAWYMISYTVELGLLLAVSLRSDKIWPLVSASVTLVGMMTLLAGAAARVDNWAYGTALIVWTYVGCGALVLGARYEANRTNVQMRRIAPVEGRGVTT